MASSGAIRTVALFTDVSRYPATHSWYDRSRIALYVLDLCGIMARGESLSARGRSFLRFSYL